MKDSNASQLSRQTVVQILNDAGCEPDVVDRFLFLKNTGNVDEQLELLSSQRANLLNKVHRKEKQIDCLDYLVYQLNKDARQQN